MSRRQQRASSGFQRHCKAKTSTTKHLHSLESHGEIEASPEAPLPDQLYFYTLSINQVTKCDSQVVEVSVWSVYETTLAQKCWEHFIKYLQNVFPRLLMK